MCKRKRSEEYGCIRKREREGEREKEYNLKKIQKHDFQMFFDEDGERERERE